MAIVGTYAHIASNTTTVLSPNPGVILNKIVINAAGTTWGPITIFDSTTGSGAVVGVISSPTVGGCFHYEATLNNGLTIVTSGGTAGDMTVVFH